MYGRMEHQWQKRRNPTYPPGTPTQIHPSNNSEQIRTYVQTNKSERPRAGATRTKRKTRVRRERESERRQLEFYILSLNASLLCRSPNASKRACCAPPRHVGDLRTGCGPDRAPPAAGPAAPLLPRRTDWSYPSAVEEMSNDGQTLSARCQRQRPD